MLFSIGIPALYIEAGSFRSQHRKAPLVFSLFSRKDKIEPKKDARGIAPRAEPRSGAGVHALAAQREAARRTEAKINQIESEMIAAEAVARAGTSSLPTEPAARPDTGTAPAAKAVCVTAAVEDGTSLVLGDAAGAMAIDVNGPALPPILEEAAILYSNGQAQPAALVLRQALDDRELGSYQPLGWLMLLDLHQCVGDRAGFEALALQYSARFESSPPGWSDALSSTRDPAHAAPIAAQPSISSRALVLPGAVDASFAEAARSFSAGAGADVQLDCASAASVDAAGAQALLGLLAHFERARTGLAVGGAARLFSLARAAIEPGRRDPSEACWMLALQALRLLGRQQDFDDLGIEYCVTYEVSPPSWEPIDESIRLVEAGETAADESPSPDGRATPACVADAVCAPAAQGDAFVLHGEVLGRMQNELRALRAFVSERGDVVVDCRSLRRMEFVAAGDLFNEVATMRSAGRQVLFVEPNYLVYALMLVMGIHDLAEIRRRRV